MARKFLCYDGSGGAIYLGDEVQMPEPNDSDTYLYSFVGTADGMHGDYLTVSDGDGDCFDVEPVRVSLYVEETPDDELLSIPGDENEIEDEL